ncbi:hypothetical protein RSOLAG1IB_01059 [Rhizoctonia solani AG-1 IB]|uniref:Uncharacterized protein n=1 Tax=Thanatephorus cucumeris (strain AG1-IB / isolate 7/3/14) TaxID=1108050 RepID=A0A0B7FAH8_THACB|nr:hypothetical protein RSOLAG1IB_01059 [Rhizoctonia solani AG-1 IB]
MIVIISDPVLDAVAVSAITAHPTDLTKALLKCPRTRERVVRIVDEARTRTTPISESWFSGKTVKNMPK